MKTCNNCKFGGGNKGCCDTCSICDDTFSNWQPLPMKEIKVEDYEVTTQVDGLVHLMRKVDEKPTIKVRVKTLDEVCFENMTKFSPEVFKRAKELWDESKIELVLPENRIIEVYPHNKEQYYYEGYYIAKNFATEILEEESCEKVDEDKSKWQPANCELVPELKSEEIMKSCNNCVNKGICSEGWFYDCHTEDKYSHWSPVEQEFKLKPLAEILEEESKPKAIENYNNSIIKHLSKMQHRIHYYKFQLEFDNDYSIRYYLEFESRPECVGNYYLKSHSKNEYSLLPKEMAEDLIRKLCKIEAEEIIGRRSGKKYEKIVVSKDKLVKFTE